MKVSVWFKIPRGDGSEYFEILLFVMKEGAFGRLYFFH